MSQYIHFLLCLAIIGAAACVKSSNALPSQNHKAIPLPKEVTRFIELLVQPKTPTFIEADRTHMFFRTMEFHHEDLECKSRGWDTRAQDCLNFQRHRLFERRKVPSLRFADIRRRLPDIVGKKYEIISVRVKDGTGKYLTAKEVIRMDKEAIAIGVVQVKIGENVYGISYGPVVAPIFAIYLTSVNGKVFYEQTEESFLHAKAWEKYQKTSKHP